MAKCFLEHGDSVKVGLYNLQDALHPVRADNCLELKLEYGRWVVQNPEVLQRNPQALHAFTHAFTNNNAELVENDGITIEAFTARACDSGKVFDIDYSPA